MVPRRQDFYLPGLPAGHVPGLPPQPPVRGPAPQPAGDEPAPAGRSHPVTGLVSGPGPAARCPPQC
ncbi:hypothetical protein E5K00_03700 [Hymenobacter aquaticus]|uniref:Uncharacterized protein n=1 Tax=Hymenobacter aquaticus TaxID=1867101 RepID=A0A4Z0Q2T3_9BACT|nr:hypothetical protein E5K00_03700 [Hymenobacter aquaticus]